MRKDWCRALRKLRRKVRHKPVPFARRNDRRRSACDTTIENSIGEIAMRKPELQL